MQVSIKLDQLYSSPIRFGGHVAHDSVIAPDLSDSPGFLIRRLQQVAVSIFIESLREFGVTPLQYTMLRVVRQNPGIDQARLASRAVLDTSTVMDVLRRLEARNLLCRKVGKEDRRTRTIKLTKRGVDLLDKAEPHVSSSRANLLAPLSKEERGQLLTIIGKLLKAHETNSHRVGAGKPWRRLTKQTTQAPPSASTP
jgi:DNA-binding MarR family transcriptional regulator